MSRRKPDVRVVAVVTDFKADKSGEPGEFAKVVFRVKPSGPTAAEWELPVHVPRDVFDDGQIIPVARATLHRVLRDLGEHTQGWAETTEGADRQPPRDKGGQKEDPT